jgi:hypothetical protein
MKAEINKRPKTRVAVTVLAACIIASSAQVARAQLLYSFEDGLDGWEAASATLANSTTLGVTDGVQSMLIDNLGPNFNNDAGQITHGAGSGNEFNIWDTAAKAIANGDTDVKLEFDFSWDHAAVTTQAWAQLGIFVNSTPSPPFTNGFREYGTGHLIGGNMGADFPLLAPAAVADGVTMTPIGENSVHLAIPMGLEQTQSDNQGLHIMPGSFYQMGFKTNGGWSGTVDWAIDNMRITGAVAPTTSETLFSWETPDNPATPAVDERFEGWIPSDFDGHPPHGHSITNTGATDGTSALQIDRTADQDGFSWGSLFVLNSDTNPDPNMETIDPVIQAQIEELISKVEAADRVAFDVTYQYEDRFPLPDPTFTSLGVHFSDETGIFYQAFGDNINVRAAMEEPATITIDIPLEEFVDDNNDMLNLKQNGLQDDSNLFRIGISTNTDGAQIYQIDNFRLVSLVPEGLPGDFNNDGAVDAADYVVWRKSDGSQEGYDDWRTNFGRTSGGGPVAGGASAVPEPASGALMIFAVAAMSWKRRVAWSCMAH